MIDLLEKSKKLRQLNEFEKAKEIINGILAQEPNNEEAHFELGNIHNQQGDTENAIQEYLQTIKINPNNEIAVYELSKAYLSIDMYEEARNICETFAKDNPNRSSVCLQLGKIYRLTGDALRANQELNKSLELDSTNETLRKWIEDINTVEKNRKTLPPYRIFITWGILHSCNYKCSYCYVPQNDINRIPSNKKIIESWNLIREKYGMCRIRLDGGEPSIIPGFTDLIKDLSGIHKLQINTNLSFGTEEFIKKISPENVRIDASYHPEYADIKVFSEKILKLKNAGFKTVVAVVGYPPFIKNIKDYKERFCKYNIPFIIHPYSGDYEDKIYPDSYSSSEKEIIYGVHKESIGELSWREEHDDSRYSDRQVEEHREAPEKQKNRRCLMGLMYARIYPDGNAYACCTGNGHISLGNIYESTFSLLEKPVECYNSGCRCWRCMVLGEEQRWLTTWLDDWEMPSIESKFS